MAKEYGYARSFVAANAEYISRELAKCRTVKSIWQEIVKDKGFGIPYRSFLYNVNIQITENNSVNVHVKKQTESKKWKRTQMNDKFTFTAQPNDEDLI